MSTLSTDNSCSSDVYRQSGIIRSMDKKAYFISMIAQSACASCSVKGACNVTEMEEKIIEVARTDKDDLKIGDRVNIVMEKSLGTKAVLLGYIIPFVLLLITLIISLAVFENEGIAGVLAVLVLIPYYVVLHFMKKKLKSTFIFRIE
jgi:sigma-E factor negative regulatory protein RseC